jgi:hypothetical protein
MGTRSVQRRLAKGGEQRQADRQPGDRITDETAVQAAQPSGTGGQHPAEPHGPPVQGDTRHAERGQHLAQVSEHAARGCRRGGRDDNPALLGIDPLWVPSTVAV